MPLVPVKTARMGDTVQVVGHRVGDAPASGEIIQVLGQPGSTHFRIRWEDGRESLLYPGTDIAVIRQLH